MEFDVATTIWKMICATKMAESRNDLIELAIRYARIRVDYYLLADAEQRGTIEDSRRCHNAFISSCDILARNMAQRGEDSTWRDQLGNERKVIGDFACYLHAILGLSAR